MNSSSREEAAQAAGISVTTLRKYMNDSEFMAEYSRRIREYVSESTKKAQKALIPALDTVNAIMTDTTASDSSRLAAARLILEYATRMTEICDFAESLERIEAMYTNGT